LRLRLKKPQSRPHKKWKIAKEVSPRNPRPWPNPLPEAAPSIEAKPAAVAPVHEAHGVEGAEDFSAALEAFERELAAEAASR